MVLPRSPSHVRAFCAGVVTTLVVVGIALTLFRESVLPAVLDEGVSNAPTASANTPAAPDATSAPAAEDSTSDGGVADSTDGAPAATALPTNVDGCRAGGKLPASLRMTPCVDIGTIVRRWIVEEGAARNWTVADIGANKGLGIGSILNALGADPDVFSARAGAKAVYEEAQKRRVPACHRLSLCGGCCDCLEDPLPALPANMRPRHVSLLAVDGNPLYADFVERTYRNCSAPAACPSGFTMDVTVRNAAATNTSEGVAEFVIDRIFGVETGVMKGAFVLARGARVVRVPNFKLDGVLPPGRSIDVLLTDAEGFDYIVADGAQRLLADHRIGLYVFETWGRDRPLSSHVSRLLALNYSCYVPAGVGGRSGWAVRPPSCWLSTLDRPTWGNIVCAGPRHAGLARALEAWAAGARHDPTATCRASTKVLRDALNRTFGDDTATFATPHATNCQRQDRSSRVISVDRHFDRERVVEKERRVEKFRRRVRRSGTSKQG